MDNSNVALITKMVLEAIEQQKASAENGYLVPVGVSARHIHLTQEHVEALFGEGYQLTKRKELMGGQYASNETVTIVGLKLRAIENQRPFHRVPKPQLKQLCAPERGNPLFWLYPRRSSSYSIRFWRSHPSAV